MRQRDDFAAHLARQAVEGMRIDGADIR